MVAKSSDTLSNCIPTLTLKHLDVPVYCRHFIESCSWPVLHIQARHFIESTLVIIYFTMCLTYVQSLDDCSPAHDPGRSVLVLHIQAKFVINVT